MTITYRIVSRLCPSLAARWSSWSYERERARVRRSLARDPGPVVTVTSRRGAQ